MNNIKNVPLIWGADNNIYTIKIESLLNMIGRIKVIIYQRDENNKRVDSVDFFMSKSRFLALISLLKEKYTAKEPFSITLMTQKDDRKRFMYIAYKPENSLYFVIRNDDSNKSSKLGFKLNLQTKDNNGIKEYNDQHLKLLELINGITPL